MSQKLHQPDLVGRSGPRRAINAALNEPASASVLVHGPFGVGRTRLVAEVARDQFGRNRTVKQIRPWSEDGAPFGALLPIAQASGSTPPTSFKEACRLFQNSDGQGPLVVVDDGHALDPSTSEVLAYVHHDLGASVLISARSGHTLAGALDELWRSVDGSRLQLHPLDDDDVAVLVAQLLGGPVDTILIKALVERSAGRPLFVRELLREVMTRDGLVRCDSEWHLNSELDPVTAIGGLLSRELDSLPSVQRTAIELLALAGSLDLSILCELTEPAAAADLERSGWLTIEKREGFGPLVRSTEPRLAELVRTSMGQVHRHQRLELLGEIATRTDSGMVAERAVLIRHEANLPLPTEELRNAVEQLRIAENHLDALSLARSAWAHGQSADDGIQLGQVLAQLNLGNDAEDVFAAAQKLELRESQRARLVLQRAENLVFSGRASAARQVCDDAIATFTDPCAADLVRAELANLFARTGDLRAARTSLEVCSDEFDPVSRVTAGLARTLIEVWGGRPGPAVVPGAAASAAAELASPQDGPPRLYELILLARGEALCFAGRFDEAIDWIDELHASTIELGIGYGVAATATLRGRVALEQGKICSAREWFVRACKSYRSFGLARFCDASEIPLALIDARHGDLVHAGSWLDDRTRVEDPETDHHIESLDARARAWIEHRSGEPDRARNRLRQTLDRLFEREDHTDAVSVLRDLAVTGHADAALEPARHLVGGLASPLLEARRDLVIAAAEHDIDLMEGCGRTLATLGAVLDAADAFGLAAACAHDDGDAGRTRLCTARGLAVEAEAEGARSTLLDRFRPRLDRLTERERTVARFAVEGMSSKDIAEKLGLSIRTVDNQLGRVYRKLDIAGRSELAVVMPSG